MAIASIADIVRTYARERPDDPVFEYEGRTVTFGELDARSNRLANALAAAGVHAGDRVAFLDKNGIEFFEVTFALTKLGAVIVAVNWRLAAERGRADRQRRRGEGHDRRSRVHWLKSRRSSRRSRPCRRFVAIGGHDRWHDYEAFLGAHDAVDPMVESRGDDVVLQLYTSGTTGLPKGVMLTNDNFFCGHGADRAARGSSHQTR